VNIPKTQPPKLIRELQAKYPGVPTSTLHVEEGGQIVASYLLVGSRDFVLKWLNDYLVRAEPTDD
jgi:hypothetical protein